jgi:hypothetical protein
MRATLAIVTALALAACSSESPLTEDEARMLGRAAVDEAIELFRAGRIRESWREFQRAEAIAAEFASQSTTGAEGEPPGFERPDDPGGPATQWVSEWREDYRTTIEISWSVIREAVREETIDFSLLKGFVTEQLGPGQLERLNREYRFATPTLLQRRSQQYWFDCDGHEEVCGLVYDALRERMGPRTVTSSWTGNRADYLGVVEVHVSVLESLTYRAPGAAATGGFPKRVSVQLEPKLRAGVGRWSRPFAVTLDGDSPGRIGQGEYGEVHRRHFEGFATQLREGLAGWPAGTGSGTAAGPGQ